MKKNRRVIFNGAFLLIVFVLTIYGVFHGEDLGAMMDAIRSADKRWLVPGLHWWHSLSGVSRSSYGI